jgi:glucose-1-phosphate cytidylyltransferase
MKAIILAGGLGSRLSEETTLRPKPMVEIGGRPILWHIMKIYSHYGFNDFVICLGFKGYMIKEYFSNYFLHQSNVTFDLRENRMEVLHKHAEPWRVTLIDTGEETMIGGRIKRILPYIGDDDAFCLTYGDGVADIDITESIAFHRREGRLATVTGTQPPGRFGALRLDDDLQRSGLRRHSDRAAADMMRVREAIADRHPHVVHGGACRRKLPPRYGVHRLQRSHLSEFPPAARETRRRDPAERHEFQRPLRSAGARKKNRRRVDPTAGRSSSHQEGERGQVRPAGLPGEKEKERCESW